MTQYAQMTSGLILPEDIARQQISAMLSTAFPAARGTYRSASGRNKNTIEWHTSSGSADVDTLGDLQTLRQQSSDLMRNEALAAGAIGTMVLGVVGPGIVPQSRIDAEYLNLTPEQAATFERAAERIFNHIANKPTFSADCRANFWQSQRLVYRSAKERGDCFALRRMIPRAGKVLNVCAQLIEADRIDTPPDKSLSDNIRAGLEFDNNGAWSATYIAQDHPGESLMKVQKWTRIDAFDGRGEPLMLHVFLQLRPGQTRGIPHLAPVIELFKQLGRYTEAEVSAAVTSAMLAIFVTSTAPVSPLGGGIPGMVAGNQVVPKGNGLMKMQSGMIVDLSPGEDIKVAEATRPNTAFEAFCDALLGAAGSALGIPRDVLTKRYNSSYSAARAALQDAWRMYLVERDDLNAQYNQPVWNWVMDEAVARGMLDAPGYFDDPLIREAYLGTMWIGPGMQSLDPLKDANSATVWNALGVKSKQDISAELLGADFDRTVKQRAKEKRSEDAAGLTPPPPAAPGAPASPTKAPAKAGQSDKAQAMSDLVLELVASAEIKPEAGQQILDLLDLSV
jgi:lambda family phage portal protein